MLVEYHAYREEILMRKIGLAVIVALSLALTISFGALASTGTQTFHTSHALKMSYPLTMHPDGVCSVYQSGKLNGNLLVVTATLVCSPGLVVGTLQTSASHCSFSLFGICFSHDTTVTMALCRITPNTGPTCVRSGFISASGEWDVTTTGWATTTDGGTGSGSTTAVINK